MFTNNMKANLNVIAPQLMRVAPSIFSTRHADKLSERYVDISTYDVLKVLDLNGWVVTSASQSRAREGNHEFAKHMIRLRNREAAMIPGQIIPEFVLTNSHDGSSSYITRAGMYRVVCSNGLIVGTDMFTSRVKHFGKNVPEKVLEGLTGMVAALPQVTERVIKMQETALNDLGQKVFAVSAIDLKMSEPINPEDQEVQFEHLDRNGFYRGVNVNTLLCPNRVEDSKPTVWNVYNRLQEKLMNGQYRQNHRRARRVQGVDSNVRLNQGLWDIADNTMAMVNEGQLG